MTSKRVFVVWLHPLFHDAVRLLLSHPNIEMVGETSNYTDVEEEILNSIPDTVIFEEFENKIPARIVAIPEKCPSVDRIIGLNLSNNELRIYHHEQKIVGQINDLIQSIIDS